MYTERDKEMKRTVRIVTVFMLVAVMMLGLTACGLDINKVAGKWHVKSINGKSAADFAAENGVIEAGVQKVVDVTEKEVSITNIIDGAVAVNKGETIIRSNGIEATIDNTLFSFLYDEKADTLSYTLDMGDAEYEYVYSRGDFDFDSAMAANQAAQSAMEDYSDEYYGEEDYYEE